MLGEAVQQGHELGFVTLTMRHRKGQKLDELWTAAAKGWRRAISGRSWVDADHDGWVRVWEVTHGRNGWHVHVHAVIVMPAGSTSADLEVLAGGMFERWSKGLQAAGLEAPLRRGQDWQLSTGSRASEKLAEYLAKAASVDVGRSLGLELTHTKPGRSREGLSTRPVWALLDDLTETGEVGPWREWERASKGKRQVGWSVGLRERFAPSIEEVSDQEIVQEEIGTADDDLAFFTADQWRRVIEVPGLALRLVQAAEFGPGMVRLLIESERIECTLVGEAATASTSLDALGWEAHAARKVPQALRTASASPRSSEGGDPVSIPEKCHSVAVRSG